MSEQVWRRMAQAADLLGADDSVRPTIFADMTALATRMGALNLGQGAPSSPAPGFVLDAARDAIADGVNQYSPGQGHPALLDAIVAHHARHYGMAIERDDVLVTTGATEALYSTILAVADPGTEVIVFEPYYDAYVAAVAAAGATLRTVELRLTPGGTFDFDPEDLRAAMSPRTSAILVNTPSNPTGKVFSREQLRRILAYAQEFDAAIITDEVYEHLVFDGATHTALSSLPGARERVYRITSAGKSFNVTGWKIGWLVAPPGARARVQTIKQFTTFVSGAPFQPAIAHALDHGDDFLLENARGLERRRDLLAASLASVDGLRVSHAEAGYFLIADTRDLLGENPGAWHPLDIVRRIAERHGVVSVPVAALCRPGSAAAASLRTSVRLSFCKTDEDTALAAERLSGLSPATFA